MSREPDADVVEALLAQRPQQVQLPDPAERVRLRTVWELTQAQVTQAVGVSPGTVSLWEKGRSEPKGAVRAAYAKLLGGIAAQLQAASDPPAPAAPAPAAAPVAVVAEADRDAAGDLVAGEALPCVLCGRSTPYRAAGKPQHLGGFCRNNPAAVATAPDAPQANAPARSAQPVTREASPIAATSSHSSEPTSTSRRNVPQAAPSPNTPRNTSGRPTGKSTAKRSSGPAAAAPTADPRFPNGLLLVLDGDGTAYCPGGVLLDCPATTIPALVDWTLAEAGIGAERLHRSGKDSDPLVVLTAAAAERFGLPLELEDRRGLRLPEDHPVVKQITRAKWKLTKRGFGPWARIYRPAQAGQRQCVQLAILPWGALDTRAWGSAGELPPGELARVLGAYATRVLTPRGSTAVSGLELMTVLRPPTRAVKDEATGTWVSGPMPGSREMAEDRYCRARGLRVKPSTPEESRSPHSIPPEAHVARPGGVD